MILDRWFLLLLLLLLVLQTLAFSGARCRFFFCKTGMLTLGQKNKISIFTHNKLNQIYVRWKPWLYSQKEKYSHLQKHKWGTKWHPHLSLLKIGLTKTYIIIGFNIYVFLVFHFVLYAISCIFYFNLFLHLLLCM